MNASTSTSTSASALDHDQVADFLRQTPDFFGNRLDLVAQLKLPHPHGGQAISIGERQLLLLRERVRNLENKLKELIQFAEENDAINDKMQQLALGLMRARALPDALAALGRELRDGFAVPHVTLRFWQAGAADGLAESEPVTDELKHFAARLAAPHCSHEVPPALRAWFGEAGDRLGSFALVPLRGDGVEGLLVLAAEDRERFHPEMGSLYLGWLGQLTAAAISRF